MSFFLHFLLAAQRNFFGIFSRLRFLIDEKVRPPQICLKKKSKNGYKKKIKKWQNWRVTIAARGSCRPEDRRKTSAFQPARGYLASITKNWSKFARRVRSELEFSLPTLEILPGQQFEL